MRYLHRPSPAMVVAGVALAVALGGTSIAAVANVPNNSVTTAKIANNAVTTPKIKNSAVNASKLASNAVTTAKIAGNAVTNAKIANGTIQPADLSAAAKTAGPPGPPGPSGPSGPAGPAGAAATSLWASVDSTGTLIRNKGAASSLKLATGDYQVVFNQDVTNCVYQATLGGPTIGLFAGQITAAQRTALPAGVRVFTQDSAGTLTDIPFYVSVSC